MSPQALKARKGEETRAQILDAAVQQASEAGFESLTIGTLAERIGLSKSGLFAHFGSRTDLQVAALDEAARRFTEEVFQPALKAPRGLARLRALFERWIGWPQRAQLRGGCPIQAASAEYDDQPGPMRDAVAERQRSLARELARAVQMAIDTGELKADTDPRQFVFELFGLVLAYYQTARLLSEKDALVRATAGFERLVACCAAGPVAEPRSRPAARRR
jgi:AcrR family transcriptional regulator